MHSDLGNDAVMVFFVLSGFVIAYVADKKEKTLRDRALSRLARLYLGGTRLLVTVMVDHLDRESTTASYRLSGFSDGSPRLAPRRQLLLRQ